MLRIKKGSENLATPRVASLYSLIVRLPQNRIWSSLSPETAFCNWMAQLLRIKNRECQLRQKWYCIAHHMRGESYIICFDVRTLGYALDTSRMGYWEGRGAVCTRVPPSLGWPSLLTYSSVDWTERILSSYFAVLLKPAQKVDIESEHEEDISLFSRSRL